MYAESEQRARAWLGLAFFALPEPQSDTAGDREQPVVSPSLVPA